MVAWRIRWNVIYRDNSLVSNIDLKQKINMEHRIFGCQQCPMYDDMFEHKGFGNCNHPNIDNQITEPYPHNSNVIEMDSSGEDLSFVQWPETPDWCPLNKEPLTIIKNP